MLTEGGLKLHLGSTNKNATKTGWRHGKQNLKNKQNGCMIE